jgi:LmbE family N-acetylglucosaminyl deacetylase
MRVLAVGAHPDDIEILCAGTLAACKARGDEIFMAVATDGRMGHKEILPPELAQVRRKEQEAAAKILGAELVMLGFRDEYVFDNEAARNVVMDLYRRVKPDFILTHWNGCYHPDHRSVEKLTDVGRGFRQLRQTHRYGVSVSPRRDAVLPHGTVGGRGIHSHGVRGYQRAFRHEGKDARMPPEPA